MNLLPPDILRRRRIFTLIIRLTAVQAVIFLSFVLFVLIFDFTLRIYSDRVQYISTQFSDERFTESEAVTQEIREIYANKDRQAEVAYWLEFSFFDSNRLDKIRETLPPGVYLLQADIDEGGALLTVKTLNLSLADIHRDTWVDTGLVSWAQLSYVSGMGDGVMRYVLNIRWAD